MNQEVYFIHLSQNIKGKSKRKFYKKLKSNNISYHLKFSVYILIHILNNKTEEISKVWKRIIFWTRIYTIYIFTRTSFFVFINIRN